MLRKPGKLDEASTGHRIERFAMGGVPHLTATLLDHWVRTLRSLCFNVVSDGHRLHRVPSTGSPQALDAPTRVGLTWTGC